MNVPTGSVWRRSRKIARYVLLEAVSCCKAPHLLDGRAPGRGNLRNHSPGLFAQASDGRAVEMHVERRVVAIDLIDEHFRIVLARRQDLELQGPGLVFQGTSAVRHQQRQELIAPTRR